MAYAYGFNPYGMPMPMQPQMGYTQPMPDNLAQLRMQGGPQMAQQMQQPVQPVQPSVVFVDSEEEARAHRVMPNCEVVFLDLSAFKVYKKRAQSIGEPTIFKTFSITEDEEPEPQQSANGARRRQQAQPVEFATKAELDAAVGMINQLATIVKQMTAPKEATTNDETAV